MKMRDGGSPKYRHDIDGLRAIAVIAVILFHADFGFAKGGFIGVDVFFVISGFLISSILRHDIAPGLAGLAHFYQRRVRRIIPAMYLMLFAVLIIASLLFLPSQLIVVAKTALATLAFGANIFFWFNTGYFDAEASLNPLLHMWSLGVEEQFYLFFPIFFWIVLKLPIRSQKAVIAGAAVISFFMGWWLSVFHPPSAFYMLPARAWELLLGCLLTFPATRPSFSNNWREAISSIGIILILLSVIVIDNTFPYPGPFALIPTLGTAAIIVCGVGGRDTFTRRVLSSKMIVAIGQRSFSLYLWHWPMLVWSKTWLADVHLYSVVIIGALICTAILAEISYRLVETPFRLQKKMPWISVLKYLAFSTALLVFLSVLIVQQRGWPSRFTLAAVRFDAVATLYPPGELKCFNETVPKSFLKVDACKIGTTNKPFDFVLWGDSHAGAISPAISKYAQEHGRAGYLAANSACPPFLTLDARGSKVNNAACAEHNHDVLKVILASKQIDTVFLSASWPRYQKENPEEMPLRLRKIIDVLTKRGKNVILVHGLPRPDFPVPWTPARLAASYSALPAVKPPYEPWLAALSGQLITSINLSKALCQANRCTLTYDGELLYRDESHLAQSASDLVITPWLKKEYPKWPRPNP